MRTFLSRSVSASPPDHSNRSRPVEGVAGEDHQTFHGHVAAFVVVVVAEQQSLAPVLVAVGAADVHH